MTADGNKPFSWLDDLYFQVGNTVPQSTAAGAATNVTGGEGFSLSREHAERLVQRLRHIRYQLRHLRSQAEAFKQMTPPADDPVSRNFNNAAAGAAPGYGVLVYGIGHIAREEAYLEELQHRLEEALGHTVKTDEHNEAVVANSAHNGNEGTYG